MSVQNPWAAHYQGVWTERGKDPALPSWLRVAALAFGRHKKNGHAQFAEGELAKLLAAPDRDGVVKIPSAQSVCNHVAKAKMLGFIAEGSNVRCLVVPPHAVIGGMGGSEWTACVIHAKGKMRTAV